MATKFSESVRAIGRPLTSLIGYVPQNADPFRQMACSLLFSAKHVLCAEVNPIVIPGNVAIVLFRCGHVEMFAISDKKSLADVCGSCWKEGEELIGGFLLTPRLTELL